MSNIKNSIINGKTSLGIEFGSTRIKAVLLDEDYLQIASGNHDWENQIVDSIWSYDMSAIIDGMQDSYRKMAEEVKTKYNVTLTTIGSIGISSMMHGYMVFDQQAQLLVPFRTWRNTITEPASEELTKVFQYPIPQRWSIAHLYQAILNKEPHVSQIQYQTTLSGFIHWKLTGQKVLGIGEASGMFPIDIHEKCFNKKMMQQFDELTAPNQYPWKLEDIFPKVLVAGEEAGVLTEAGAKLLDVTGQLQPGIIFCPPEADAATGMVATNSVAKRTGNVSAGTSVFAMIVLEKELSKVYPEIDLVTTPTGDLVAMVHCNNCTSELNAWVSVFKEFAEAFDIDVDMTKLFSVLYGKALEGDADCGGLLAYNYFSGEHITGFEKGCPLFVRSPEDKFTLSNFMRVQLFTSLGALKLGMDILTKQEGVRVEQILGHGGLFKTPIVGQHIMAAAINTPVTVMNTAGEGGAWGIALLAAYMQRQDKTETLDEFLNHQIFEKSKGTTINPKDTDVKGFEEFMEHYCAGLVIERAAVDCLK
ncbi:MAG: FGGY-family carbohydrate kinase [Lachnospiraceae bacterium]